MRHHRYITIAIALCFALGLKAQKKVSPEYVAKREATAQAIDTLLRNQAKYGFDLDKIQILVDEKCKEMNYDPTLMSKIATSFGRYGNDEIAFDRFRALKKKYPKNIDVYVDFANLLHATAEREGYVATEEPLVQLAKAQLDSAKVAVPTSMRPYSVWIWLRAPLIAAPGAEEDLEAEVEAWNKAFPDSAVYAKASRLFADAKMIEKYKDRYHAPSLRKRSLGYFEKAGIDKFSAREVAGISQNFYFTGDFEEGAKTAVLGLGMGEELLAFHHLSLWNNALSAQKALWYDQSAVDKKQEFLDHALESAQWLMNYPDSMGYKDFVYAGIAYQENKEYQKAINFFNKSLATPSGALDPSKKNRDIFQYDSLATYLNLSRCYEEIGDHEQRIKCIKEAIRVDENPSGNDFLKNWRELGYAYGELSRDTLKYTDSERLMALMSADSIFSFLQHNVDNGLEHSWNMPDCYFLNFQLSRRLEMDRIDENRTICKTLEIAEAIYSRLEPRKSSLSEDEIRYLVNAYRSIRNHYANNGNALRGPNRNNEFKKALLFAQKMSDYPQYLSQRDRDIYSSLESICGIGKKRR